MGQTADGAYSTSGMTGHPSALSSDTDTSADFVGNMSHFSAPHSNALNMTGQLSIEAWIKPDILTGTRYILNKTTGNVYSLYVADGKLVFRIRSGGVYRTLEAPGVLTTGSWQHVVGTFNGSTFSLYRNGVKVAETTPASCPCTVDTSVNSLYVGALDSTTGWFDGGVDEVAVYGSALSASQVQNHYDRR
ncbi:MAG: LamG domain-containing protein [Actinomycetota bacterium]|nr:LamG domain-containing protein [Actinomycetota bacterium]